MKRQSLCVTALLIILLTECIADPVVIDRLHARLSYVVDQERRTRQSFSGDPASLEEKGTDNVVIAREEDTLVVQVSCARGSETYFPEQSFVRFWDQGRRQEALYIMQQSRGMMRTDITFRKEMKSKNGFYRPESTYSLEVIVGDRKIKKGITWVITKKLKFQGRAMITPTPGVFDFDLSVKKHLLPEFETKIPKPSPRAPSIVVMIFSVLALLPCGMLLQIWRKLGVYPLVLPKGQDFLFFLGFQLCIAVQIAVLAMFWIGINGMNILDTWKWLGGIMLPTLICGHRTLSNVAARDAATAEVSSVSDSSNKKSPRAKKKD